MKLRIHTLVVLGLLFCIATAPVPAQDSESPQGQDQDQDQDQDNDDDGDDGRPASADDIDDLVGSVNDLIDVGIKAGEFYGEWTGLDEEVDNCGAAWNDMSAPTVPSQCGDAQCVACYQGVSRKIDFNRFYIERARCITASTVKMANSAMAFGDSTSGIHAVAGLSWQLQGKPVIEKEVRKIKGTYTKKAGQYLGNLDQAMQELGQCEARHYGERDWYQRYGWIYVNFMKAKYASPPE